MSASRRTRTAVQLAVGVGGQLDVLDLAAAVDRRQGVLRARLVPAHGDAVALGEGHAQQLLGVDVELRSEATADGRGDDADLLLGEPEGDRRHDLEDVRDLRRRVQRDVAAERLGHGDDGPRLHRHRDQALLDVALLDGVGGGGEGGVDLALGALDLERPGVAAVGAEVVVDDDAVGQGVLEIDDRRRAARTRRRRARRHRGRRLRTSPARRRHRRRRSTPCPWPAGSAAGSSCRR